MFFDPAYLETLGLPLPPHPHAVSVVLPTYAATVGYEEGDAAVLGALQTGYPRFRLHNFVQGLRESYRDRACRNETLWVFPSARVAAACVDYAGGGWVRATHDGVAIAYIDRSLDRKAKEFWQHTGLIVSSRQAEAILRQTPRASDDAVRPLKQLIGKYNGASADDVYLYPTGMAAIFRAYQAVTCRRGTETVMLGFPYTDTLKIQQKFGEGAVYLPYNVPEDLRALEKRAKQGRIAAVFCEIPSNPLGRTVDLPGLNVLRKRYNFPVIIDDTLGPPCNVDISPYADATATSLTKFFSGKGNVMGGSLRLNPDSPHYADMKNYLCGSEELLYGADAQVLLENGQGFFQRMQLINRNAEALVDFLRDHPAVGDVFYPKGDPAYEAIRKPGGGYGGLFSLTLKDESFTPAFFDNLKIAKGPGLGTEFTLACYYTLLAHYGELPWARKQGVSRNLVRFSVGVEDGDEIIHRVGDPLPRTAPQWHHV
jgi:cystathionine gamma-synthase